MEEEEGVWREKGRKGGREGGREGGGREGCFDCLTLDLLS